MLCQNRLGILQLELKRQLALLQHLTPQQKRMSELSEAALP